MNHTITVTIPNRCFCEILADGEIVPVHQISLQIDTHTRRHLISVQPQSPIPANVEKLEVRLELHQNPIRVVLLPVEIPLQASPHRNMELADPNDFGRLLEYLQSLLDRLKKSSPEK